MATVSFGAVPLRVLLVLFVVVQLMIFIFLFVLRVDQKPASELEGILESQRQRIAAMSWKVASGWPGAVRAPPLEYERTRRRLRFVVEEFWYFIDSQLKGLQVSVPENRTQTTEKIAGILGEGIDYKRALLREVLKLSEVDDYNKWRSREAADLSDLVQKRLRFLQNPRDCRKARKLVCDLRKWCGFGCQLHHVVYCLITAYSSQRTMILISQGWKYNGMGWEAVFQPLSETCLYPGFGNSTFWNGFIDTTQVVRLPVVEFLLEDERHPYLPRAVPKDLATRISKLHEVPAVWWVGQMVKYLTRLQPRTKDTIAQASLNMTFKRPIVGVHIRRSDKLLGEAGFHSVDEYMSHVEEYYKQMPSAAEKRIYLASDDVTVFKEIQAKYPDYAVVGNPNVSEMAAKKRYCNECLDGLVVDLHLLANSDFLVCTFSSQVCRVAYEIMQSLHPDAAARFRSLDDLYYFGGGGMRRAVAVVSHRAASEGQMDLQVGDHLKVFGNLWNGFSEGFNFRSKRSGLFPSYKVEDVIEAVDFPSAYPQVPQKSTRRLVAEIQNLIDNY